MKKLKIVLLIAIIICLAGITNVYAADASAELHVDKNTVKQGDTITVTLDAACSDGLSYLGTQIEPGSNFTVENETVSNGWKNYGNNKLELMVDTQETITSGTLYTLVLKIKDTVEAGILKISTTGIEIMDKNNVEYTKPKSEIEITVVEKLRVAIEQYNVKKVGVINYLKEIKPGETIANITGKVITNGTKKVYKGETEITDKTTKIATGNRLAVEGELDQAEEYTLVVTGDCTGDGKADIKDMVKINNYRLYGTTTNFEGAYQEAADINKDGKIDIKDMVRINNYRLYETEI